MLGVAVTDHAREAADLLRIVRSMPETPKYLHSQMVVFSQLRRQASTTRDEGTVEALLLLWDVAACEDLPEWVRSAADRLRRAAWPAGYRAAVTAQTEVDDLCARR